MASGAIMAGQPAREDYITLARTEACGLICFSFNAFNGSSRNRTSHEKFQQAKSCYSFAVVQGKTTGEDQRLPNIPK